MSIQTALIVLLCGCFVIGLANAIYDDDKVFEESSYQVDEGLQARDRLADKMEVPEKVALILTREARQDQDLIWYHPLKIADIIQKVNRFQYGDCTQYDLKQRLQFCEQMKEIPVLGFTVIKENMRLFCRAAFQLVAKECVRLRQMLTVARMNDNDYLVKLNEAVERTEAGQRAGDTLNDKFAEQSSPLEEFVLNQPAA